MRPRVGLLRRVGHSAYRDCPHDCPCDAPKQRFQGQQEPTRSIGEVENSEGFARKVEDRRETDFRLANRCVGRFRSSFQHFSFAGLTRVGHLPEEAGTARLYWKSP